MHGLSLLLDSDAKLLFTCAMVIAQHQFVNSPAAASVARGVMPNTTGTITITTTTTITTSSG